MPNTIQYNKRERKWQNKYEPGAPKVGDHAPDFELVDISGEYRVSLSDYIDHKPVGLIFGSFT